MGFPYRFSFDSTWCTRFADGGTWNVHTPDSEGCMRCLSGFGSIHECVMRILLITGMDVSDMKVTWTWWNDDMYGRFITVMFKPKMKKNRKTA